MAVFPEQMNRLNVNDVPGSLKVIEGYIRYMTERMEFSNKNTTRSVTEAGVSSVTVYEQLLEVVNALSVMSSTLGSMAGDINTLNSRVTETQGSISGMASDISTIQGNISTIQSDIADLKDRVAALEGAG